MPTKTWNLYQGRVNVYFEEARHWYWVRIPGVVDRLYVPSVTTVIGQKDKSGALVNWATRSFASKLREMVAAVDGPLDKNTLNVFIDSAESNWRDLKQQAADVGSIAHRALEQYLAKEIDEAGALNLRVDTLLAPNVNAEMIEQAKNSIGAGIEFIKKHRIEVVQAECPRYSPTWSYIGTGDLIARIDGDLAVLDWKSGKRIYGEVAMQLAAYQQAYQEETGEAIQKRVAVNIGRDGTLETRVFTNDTYDNDFLTFRALLQVWKWDCVNGYRKREVPQYIGPLDNLVPRPSTTPHQESASA